MAKAKKTTYVSMIGVARYPWLNKPDTKFKQEGQPGDFHIDLVINEEALDTPVRTNQGKTLDITYRELFDNALDQSYQLALEANPKDKRKITKKPVVREITDEEGEPTGELFIPFKQNSEIRPKGRDPVIIKRIPQFDAKGRAISERLLLGGGSLVKVAFTIRNEKPDGDFDKPSVYVAGTKEVHLRLDLQAVQVLKFVEGGAGGQTAERFGFGSEEDYEGIEDPEDGDIDDTDDEDEDGGDF